MPHTHTPSTIVVPINDSACKSITFVFRDSHGGDGRNPAGPVKLISY